MSKKKENIRFKLKKKKYQVQNKKKKNGTSK